MNPFWKLSPTYLQPSMARQDELAVTRERILQTILLTAMLLGFPAIAAISANSFQNSGASGQFWVRIGMYVALYSVLVLITVLRRLPFGLRASFLIFLLYSMAVAEVVDSGQLGELRMYLVVFVAISAVLLRLPAVIAAVAASFLTIVGTGLLSISPYGAMFPALENLRFGTDWVTSSIASLMINSMVSGAVLMIVNGLDRNLKRQTEMARRLEEERNSLEQRVLDRTASLKRRNTQLHTAAEISRAVSGLTDSDQLLQMVVDLIKERYGLYYAGVFLVDAAQRNAVLRAGTGQAGLEMLARNHQLAVGGSSMIGWSIANRAARIAQDARAEDVRFNNPYLPDTRSELALPVIVGAQCLGALTVQSDQPNAFDEDDIAILQGVADSLAVALENARLYQQTQQSLDEIRTLNRQYLQNAWAETRGSYGSLQYDYQNPQARAGTMPQTEVEVPIVLRDEVIGHMIVEMDRPSLSEEETKFVENVTAQSAIALESARLLYESERQAVQEQKMNELASGFARALTIDEILRVAAREFGQLPSVSEVSVQLHPAGAPERSARKDGGNGKGGREQTA